MKRSAFLVAFSLGAWLLAPCAAASPATASLREAEREAADLRYDRAVAAAFHGIEKGGATPGEMIALWSLVGRSTAVMNRPEDAAEAFGKALQLAPGLSLPPGTSPKIVGPFEQAQGQLAGRALKAAITTRISPSGEAVTTLAISGDAFQLVHDAQLKVRRGSTFETTAFARATPPQAHWSCPEGPCNYYAVVRDLYGNALLEVGSGAAPMVAERPPPLHAPRPFLAKPLPYFAAAGVCALTGAVLAYQFQRDQSKLRDLTKSPEGHDYSEALSLDRARGRTYPWMLGALGASAGFGLIGTGLLLW